MVIEFLSAQLITMHMMAISYHRNLRVFELNRIALIFDLEPSAGQNNLYGFLLFDICLDLQMTAARPARLAKSLSLPHLLRIVKEQ
jgi:hypothetical protein